MPSNSQIAQPDSFPALVEKNELYSSTCFLSGKKYASPSTTWLINYIVRRIHQINIVEMVKNDLWLHVYTYFHIIIHSRNGEKYSQFNYSKKDIP
jgi:hypothetical protein